MKIDNDSDVGARMRSLMIWMWVQFIAFTIALVLVDRFVEFNLAAPGIILYLAHSIFKATAGLVTWISKSTAMFIETTNVLKNAQNYAEHDSRMN